MRRRKGEVVSLLCSHCRWSTEIPMADTEASRVVLCAHCGKPIYWHRCETCDLRYLGGEQPQCPLCDDTSADEISID